MSNHRLSFIVGCLLSTAACAPQKSYTQQQIDKLVQNERAMGQEIDSLAARAAKLKADCANAWNGK